MARRERADMLAGVRAQPADARDFPSPDRALPPVRDETVRAAKRALLPVHASEAGDLGRVGRARECFRPLARHDYGRPPRPGRRFSRRFQWAPRRPRVDRTRPAEVCRAIASFVHASFVHATAVHESAARESPGGGASCG